MQLTFQKKDWPVYAAAAWALIFALFHLIWAAGWYVGLDAEQTQKAFAKPLFLAFDLLIAVMCMIAVPVALALVRPWGERLPRKMIGALAWSGSLLLGLRAVASLIQTVYLVAAGKFAAGPRMVLWEAWFYVGAILWGLTVWKFKVRKGVWVFVGIVLTLFLALYLYLFLSASSQASSTAPPNN